MPQCPQHQVELKVSQFGGFYCPSKNADGSYCKFKLKAPKTEQTPPVPIAAVVPGPNVVMVPGSQPNLVPLAAASLEMAGRFYSSSGVSMVADSPIRETAVINLAMRAFAAMKALVVQ